MSYGGVQSNAMAALLLICKEKGWEFIYFVKQIPTLLKNEPCGNYEYALQNGLEMVELGHESFYEKIQAVSSNLKEGELFVPQGGASPIAEEGLKILAMEINSFFETKSTQNRCVVCSSGTGALAFYLAKHLNNDIMLVTIPCVGDINTLKSQWKQLGELKKEPTIINTDEKIRFGKPHPRLFELYSMLKNSGQEFDLLYDVKALLALAQNMHLFLDCEILFVHSGGLYGNSSQLKRYKRTM